MLAVLVASRGLIIKSQEAYMRVQAYGKDGIAIVPDKTDNLFKGVKQKFNCENTPLYDKVAELYEEVDLYAKKSAQAFGQTQQLASPAENLIIGIPAFYKQKLDVAQKIAKGNRKAIVLCDKTPD